MHSPTRTALVTPVLQAHHPLLMALMVTFIALMGEKLAGTVRHALAPAKPPLSVWTVCPAQRVTAELTVLVIPAKPLLPLLTRGLMVSSTASMGVTLVGQQAPAPAQSVTLDSQEIIANLQFITCLIWKGYSTQ